MFVDEMDHRLRFFVDADARVVSGGRGEDGLAVECTQLRLDAQMMAREKGVQGFGENHGGWLAVE